jgi:hypothetical protein
MTRVLSLLGLANQRGCRVGDDICFKAPTIAGDRWH